MLFPTGFILPFLALLITPIMSVPIIGPRHLTVHPLHAGLEKRSPPFRGQHHGGSSSAVTKRSIPDYSHLVAREDPGSILEARTFDDTGESALDKRTRGPIIVRLVRKSIAAKIRAGFKKVGEKFNSFKQTVKKGFEKARTWIKDTGAKVVKFGAKIYATAAKTVGRIASAVLPSVGRAISAVTNGISYVANLVSDKIKVKLPPKLQKGVDVMNTIQDPLSKLKSKAAKAVGKVGSLIGLKRDFVEKGPFLERDLSGTGELIGRSIDIHSYDNPSGLNARSLDGLSKIVARSAFKKDDA